MTTMHMSLTPEYPLPHNYDYGFAMSAEPAAATATTIMPLLTYDEGLGAINSAVTNPARTGFVEKSTDHCYPTSRINNINALLRVNLTKGAIETDKIQILRYATMMIYTSFQDAKLASDEISTLNLHEILELQDESTDRQTAPLYNTVKMLTYKSNALLDMPAETAPFLDTDLEIEGVAFSSNVFYDALHYHTTHEKLRTVCSGLRWHTLTRNKPYKVHKFFQNSKTKVMNPYAFLGAMIYLPAMGGKEQYGTAAETTAINHIGCTLTNRFNEWNHEFDHRLQ